MMTLYDYFRSTACYRVRLALSLKGIAYTRSEIHLVNHGGEQHGHQYKTINPQQLVPSLEVNGHILTQSLAIIEYLEETSPQVPLFPSTPQDRAWVRALALLIACDMHPLNNLKVLNQLKTQFKADQSQVQAWYHHWLKEGFDAFEAQLENAKHPEPFCFGKQLTIADIFLIPQVYNAHRFEFNMGAYPLINRINAHCLELEAVQKAMP